MSTPIKGLKCPNWIKPRFTPKTKKRKADKRASIYCYDFANRFPEYGDVSDEHERCHGNLSATVRLLETPEWGGSVTELELTVECDACGRAYLQPDPRTTDEQWIEQLIAEALEARGQTYYGG